MKNTWDLMKEVAKDEVRKRGDYTELAELKKVEREANKRLGYKSKLERLVENPPKHLKPEPLKDGRHDHGCDMLRYFFINQFPIKRNKLMRNFKRNYGIRS